MSLMDHYQERLRTVVHGRTEQEVATFDRLQSNAIIAAALSDETRADNPRPDYASVWKQGILVLPEMFPDTFQSLRDVMAATGCKFAVAVFLFNQYQRLVTGAGALHSPDPRTKPGRLPDLIVLNTTLSEGLTPEEMHFLFGHEVGHLMHDHCPAFKVFGQMSEKGYPDLPVNLVRDIRRWRLLIECAADRCGLIACGGNVYTAASTLVKLASEPARPQTRIETMLPSIRNMPRGINPLYARIRWLIDYTVADGSEISGQTLRLLNEVIYDDICHLVP